MSTSTAPSSGCSDIEAIAIRGTTEPQGGGIIAGPQATALKNAVKETVKTFNLVYPASFDYQRSKAQGVTALKAELSKTSAACPDTRFVIIGYSQGADVIGDTLQAGNVPAAGQIGAIAMFGDPAFNSKEKFVTGSFKAGTNGVFPRRTGALAQFADRIVSFCNGDDTFCQRGATGTGHFRYESGHHGDLWLDYKMWKPLSAEEKAKRRDEFRSGEPGFSVTRIGMCS